MKRSFLRPRLLAMLAAPALLLAGQAQAGYYSVLHSTADIGPITTGAAIAVAMPAVDNGRIQITRIRLTTTKSAALDYRFRSARESSAVGDTRQVSTWTCDLPGCSDVFTSDPLEPRHQRDHVHHGGVPGRPRPGDRQRARAAHPAHPVAQHGDHLHLRPQPERRRGAEHRGRLELRCTGLRDGVRGGRGERRAGVRRPEPVARAAAGQPALSLVSLNVNLDYFKKFLFIQESGDMDSDGIENEWLLSSDDVNAKHIHGLPMEYVESGIAPDDYLPVLALFLKWVTIIQGMLDAGEVSGLKFALGFFYTQLTPDIDMAHMLGDESMNVKGQIESLSDWLFNPECKHPKSNLQCEFFYEGTSYFKRDFSHLVYVLNAGFLGEWFGAGWIGDWEGPEDMDNDGVYENDGTHADANRKRLLDQLMNMVPFSNVQIRYPMIKNDYFDADESVDMTYLNGDLDLQITAVSEREDLKCEEPFSSSDAATPMCAKRRLGYYNAAPLTESNEGCTYPCNTSDRGKSYKDLYLEESAWVSSGAEFGDYDFPQFSSLNLYVDTGRLAENNCTSQFLDTSIEQSPTEMCYNCLLYTSPSPRD